MQIKSFVTAQPSVHLSFIDCIGMEFDRLPNGTLAKSKPKVLGRVRSKVGIWLPYLLLHVFILPGQFLSAVELGQAGALAILLYLFTVVVCVGLFWTLLYFNPGCIHRHRQDLVSNQIQENTDRLCVLCDITRPPRSKHCYACNHCVSRFDHHCPFLGVCIGSNNHRVFWSFLFSTTVLLIWTSVTHIKALELGYEMGKEFEDTHTFMIIYQVLSVSTALVLLLVSSSLLLFHSVGAMTNITTYEIIVAYRTDYWDSLFSHSQGLVENLRQFITGYPQQPTMKEPTQPVELQQVSSQ